MQETTGLDKNWMFRKNAGTGCLGVDLNRNFPEGYGVGASKNPCDEVYKGKKTSIDFIPKDNHTWVRIRHYGFVIKHMQNSIYFINKIRIS